MKKGTRRILFWLAVAIFGAASYIVVLFAQGYTYDLTHKRFVLTGAIAVTANTDAMVFVGDRQADTMSFLGHRTGMDRLTPGTYEVRVTRDGYTGWHKSVGVQEGLLTDFPSVLLLPTDKASSASLTAEFTLALKVSRTLADATPAPTPSVSPTPKPRKTTPTPTPLPQVAQGGFILWGDALLLHDFPDQPTASGSLVAEKVLGFQVSDDQSRVLWWTRNELWVLWVRSTDYQPFRAANERQLITRFSVPIARAGWFRDRDHIVADLGTEGYRVLETDARGGLNIFRFSW